MSSVLIDTWERARPRCWSTQAIDRALNDHLGPGASMFVHAVFSLHDPEEARELLDTAGFDRIEIETDTLPPAPAAG